MFEQTFVDGVGKTNKSWTVVVSFVGQIVLITVAVILPLIYTEVLPTTTLQSFLVAPPPPPPPPPPPAAAPGEGGESHPTAVRCRQIDGPEVGPEGNCGY